MASILLPYATRRELQAVQQISNRDHDLGGVAIELSYSGATLSGVTVLHTGFVEPQDREPQHDLFVDLLAYNFSGLDLDAINLFLPLGYTATHEQDGEVLRITRSCQLGLNMLPLELVPYDEQDDWQREAQRQRDGRYPNGDHRWRTISIMLSVGDPDMTLDVRSLDFPLGAEITRTRDRFSALSWRRWDYCHSRGHETFRHIEPRTFQSELDHPNRVWLSVLCMAEAGHTPGYSMPRSDSNFHVARHAAGRRGQWQRYGNTPGGQIEKLFLASQREVAARGEGRLLDVADQDPATQRCEWPDMTPPLRQDAPKHMSGLAVLGVKPGATGFTRYRPERVWPHLRGYEKNAMTWGGDRVFVHRGHDAWRFLFAFEDAVREIYSPDRPFHLAYCIPVVVSNKEADPKRVVTFRGMPLDLQEAVWSVPGMSAALSHALNSVKFQLTKRVPLELYSGQQCLPKNHFVVALGTVQHTAISGKAEAVFGREHLKTPFECSYGPMAGLADVLVHLFGLSGQSSLVQPVSKIQTRHAPLRSFGAGFDLLDDETEVFARSREDHMTSSGQLVSRCLDL